MPDRVTSDDVKGLRAETGRLADSLEGLAVRQSVTETAVESKADTETVEEIGRLAGRANVNSTLATLAVLLALVAAFYGWRSTTDRVDAADKSRAESRITVCNAYNADVADKVNGILLGLAAGASDPAGAEAAVAHFLIPRRACDPAGIAAYYSTPQGAGAYETTTTTTPGG